MTGLTPEKLEEICLRAVQSGVTLPQSKDNVRCFYLDVGEPVGACGGQVVSAVYVEWHSSGTVHGRPMTPSELRKRGANL